MGPGKATAGMPAAEGSRTERRSLTALLTSAVAFPMLELFVPGALDPRPVGEPDVSATVLGLSTTVGFGTAAVPSPVGGPVVDRIGPRRSLPAPRPSPR